MLKHLHGNQVREVGVSMTKKTVYSKELMVEAISASKSYSDVCRFLNLKPHGSNNKTIKGKIELYELDVSHFTGQGHSKGKSLVKNPKSKRVIKQRLISTRGHKCENCKTSTWCEGKPIVLELEHIDGNNENNILENLLLLCPNCHSQTKTWKRGKSSFAVNPKRICPECSGTKGPNSIFCQKCRKENPTRKRSADGRATKQYYCKCGTEINRSSKQCLKCAHVKQQRAVWPSVGEVVALVSASSFVAVGRSLGVSDNAVRKFLRGNGVDPKTLLPFVE